MIYRQLKCNEFFIHSKKVCSYPYCVLNVYKCFEWLELKFVTVDTCYRRLVTEHVSFC
jgi:hypothetical protein